MIRILWGAMGGIAVFFAVLGAILPLLPTVPFILLAAFCFARSSTRAHNWLMNHKTFGPMIHDWQTRGAISLRSKKIATATFVGSITMGILFGLPPIAIIGQVAALTGTAIFLWTRPSA